MASKLILLLVTVACLLNLSKAITTNVLIETRDCYFEELNTGDKLSVTFQVNEGGDSKINFEIYDPAEKRLKNLAGRQSGLYSIVAQKAGRFRYCFWNYSKKSAKNVSFNAFINEETIDEATNQEDPLKHEIDELADSILAIKAGQEYIVSRERVHRDTAESTNDRVKWWSVAQIGLLIGVCMWQVHYLKHFFEVKRAV
ncbi:emp24/gp25L/p24 family/GOLD-domain-containing protein [Mycotypha africana]|uniref:emp24/gp25L/p24 family/GOLD-domain-containing protein n=1 Tax=Mycotypha africana TaxID=64632 RepID=UPI002301DD6E|nr:emp24/gp25L/p24 family/GOLD-domain-containing protein [Mycotypha africana]KAI8988446.1 emp24/gp25L/p24 family/GOLD-domain-containing protein [Mycotypha africana]